MASVRSVLTGWTSIGLLVLAATALASSARAEPSDVPAPLTAPAPLPAPSPPTAAALPITGPPELLARGEAAQRALAPLKQGLMSTLKAALAESPASAVAACQLAAPGIAAGASSDIYTVGRTSDRLRNPRNAPAPWMQPLLTRYAKSATQDDSGHVVALEDGAIGYVEPIRIQPLCTTCHGAAVDPALLAEIRSRYPDDRAIDYAPGDFRGLFWVVANPEP